MASQADRWVRGSIAACFAFFVLSPIACSSSGDGAGAGLGLDGGLAGLDGSNDSNAAGQGPGSGTGTGGSLAGIDAALVTQLCGDTACACSNGTDDDGDGKVDGFDEECTGPLDNDEGSFATGISGDNRDPKWQDCFFDGNSGAGDDKCRYHTECLTGERDPSDRSCQVSDACREFCQARTPNGCDCFGCCTISTDSGEVSVVVGEGCSLENVEDESACQRCTPSDECGNTCGECELCPGRTVEDLPDSCQPEAPPDAEPPPSYTCDDGEPCTTSADCPSDGTYYCQLGCCQVQIR